MIDIVLPLYKLLPSSRNCNTLKKEIKCESFKIVLNKSFNNSHQLFSHQEIATLIGNGLCRRVYYKITNTYPSDIKDVLKYIKEHPLFENEDDKVKYRKDLRYKLDNLEYRKNKWSPNVDVYKNNPHLIYMMMKQLVDEDIASEIAHAYSRAVINRIDIAKCIVIYSDHTEKKKNIIRPLTFEEGLNTSVEELL